MWVVTAAALVVLFIFARENYLNTPLKSIQLISEADTGFVRKSELREELKHICNKSKNIGTINMIAVQNHLNSNPWIEDNASFIDMDGTLNVSFKEYEPKFRVFDREGHSAYVTQEGMVVPACNNYTPYVLVASGNFELGDTTTYALSDTLDRDRNLLNALYWYKAIKANPFVENCVGQLYCNNKNQFELTVKGLEARVIVGDTCLAADKLNRLEIFMKQRISSPETHNMKIINLNYKNQIVCTKR